MALLKSMRDTGEKMWAPYGHDKCDIYFSRAKFDLDRYEIYFVCTEIRIIICGLLTNKNTGI